jgi:hypothetical protein
MKEDEELLLNKERVVKKPKIETAHITKGAPLATLIRLWSAILQAKRNATTGMKMW